MASGVRLNIDGKEANGALSGLLGAVSDLRPMLKDVGEYVVGTTKERFRRSVSPEGQPWAPLNPLYAAKKTGPGILRENGRLAEIVYQLASDSVLIGSTRIYAAIHQFGGTIKPKSAAALVFGLGGKTIFARSVTIPKREFLGLTDDDQAEIRLIAENFLNEASGGTARAE